MSGAAPRRSLRFKLVAAGVLLALAAAGAEAAARSVGAEIPSWKLADNPGIVMTGHPSRLWGLSPGVRQNGTVTATVNALGMRGAEPDLPKPAGRLRLLLVGDSTWFGHGVADDATFSARLEAGLRAQGLDVDVLNGGVPGYSTEQSRLFLEERGWSLEPDLLLVGNVWSDNNVDPYHDRDLLETARAARENPLFASYFFRLLATNLDSVRGGTGARLVTWTKESRYPTDGVRRVPITRYGENLDWMARTAAERGVGVAFVAPCNMGMVQGLYQDGASWDVYFNAQKSVAEHHGAPWISTKEAMQAGGNTDALFVDVLHPSAAGHAIFADTARAALNAAGWPGNKLLARDTPFPWETLTEGRIPGQLDPSSPQRNLFPGSRAVATSEGAPPGEGGPERPGTPPGPPEPGEGGPAVGNAPRWAVEGTVRAAAPPVSIEVRGDGGAVVSSVRLGAAGPFRVNVRGDLAAVDLVITDAAGATWKRRVARGEAVGEVVLGGGP